jgi:lysyl-tRNA synthetase class I
MSYVAKIDLEVKNAIKHIFKNNPSNFVFTINQIRKEIKKDSSDRSYTQFLFKVLKKLEKENQIIRLSKTKFKINKSLVIKNGNR